MITDIVLFSGGLDSAAILLGRDKAHTLALFIDYGQSHEHMEYSYARAFADRHGYALGFLDATGMLSGGLCGEDDESPVVPLRNALLLNLACSVAQREGAQRVWIGCNRDDRKVFADCRPAFRRAYNAMLEACESPVRVHMPLTMATKRDVKALLRDRGGAVDDTWSCYHPTDDGEACGKCLACLARNA